MTPERGDLVVYREPESRLNRLAADEWRKRRHIPSLVIAVDDEWVHCHMNGTGLHAVWSVAPDQLEVVRQHGWLPPGVPTVRDLHNLRERIKERMR